MRALTLRPHWAHAVAHLSKRIENRTRPIPPALVGQRMAIHAGAELPRDIGPQWARHDQAVGERWCAELAAHTNVDTLDRRWRWANDLTCRRAVWDDTLPCLADELPIATRAIVAVATLREPFVSAADWRADGATLDELPPWAEPEADYWWELSEVRTLAEPVPVRRGQLGLWRLDDVTEAAVTAAAKEAV